MLPSSWLARWNVLHGAPSAHRFLHELADPCLVGGSQLRQREGDRPQGAFVEVRAVVEAERRVPRLELVRGLEEPESCVTMYNEKALNLVKPEKNNKGQNKMRNKSSWCYSFL